MTRLRTLAVTAAAALSLTLTGCGLPERIVHLQDAPTVEHTGAPLRADAAERIAARVLGEVAAAESADERRAAIYGPAMRVINAREEADVVSGTTSDVVVPTAPTVIALSEGEEWPRAILAATLDQETQVQSVHVLVSTGPASPFRLYATAPMFAGTSVPSLGALADGADFERATDEEPIDQSAILEEYAKAVAFPAPEEESADVSVEDPFADSLRANAKAQSDALDDLANLKQTNRAIPDSVTSFRTAGGGSLIFGQMVREDVITLTDKAKELTIDNEVLQELSGKEKVTKRFTTESLKNLLFIQPADGPATLIGAEEIVLRASGE